MTFQNYNGLEQVLYSCFNRSSVVAQRQNKKRQNIINQKATEKYCQAWQSCWLLFLTGNFIVNPIYHYFQQLEKDLINSVTQNHFQTVRWQSRMLQKTVNFLWKAIECFADCLNGRGLCLKKTTHCSANIETKHEIR